MTPESGQPARRVHRQIIIQLKKGKPLRQSGEGSEIVLLYGGEPLTAFDALVDGDNRILRQSFPELVRRLEEKFGPSAVGPLPGTDESLDLFLRMSLFDPGDNVLSLLESIRALPQVERAMLALPRSPHPPTLDCSAHEYQGYMNRSVNDGVDGVDACYAWNVTADPPGLPDGGGAGEGVTVCVCDQGYSSAHVNAAVVAEEYGAAPSTLYPGQRHGTKVLGVLGSPGISVDAEFGGTVGMCPAATFHFAGTEDNEVVDVKATVADALLRLGEGDVLVLESQLSVSGEGLPRPAGAPNVVPVEANRDVRVALNSAIFWVGVTVVEAAGDGGAALVEILDSAGTSYWNPATDLALAIVVGAGSSTDHSCVPGNNYGDRVDCQGWGDSVVAPTSPDGERAVPGFPAIVSYGTNDEYDPAFRDTSAATAILGGVVACIQGAHHAVFGTFVDPIQLRDLLRNPVAGNPPPVGSEPIGPLPDLYRILCKLGICPDLFLRDHLLDDGSPEPMLASGLLPFFRNRSPDIVLLHDPLADPDAEFGLATYMVEGHAERVKAGKNHLYVRTSNRGNATDSATLHCWASAPSSFLHPRWWRRIDPEKPVRVPLLRPAHVHVSEFSFDVPALAEPIHFCPIAVLNTTRGDGERPRAAMSTSEFRAFLRMRNDVAFGNVHVVSPQDRFRYHLRGVPEGASSFRLTLASALPPGTLVSIEPDQAVTFTSGAFSLTISPTAPYSGPILAGHWNVDLPQNAEIVVELRVKLPAATLPGRYESTIDQWEGTQHLGRITYVVVVPPAGPA